MEVLLANPRSFCAGVDRAVAIVEQTLSRFGAPIYVHHEIVHNKFVLDDLRAKGAVFVESLDDVPSGSTLVFDAHGVSKAVRQGATSRGLATIDATCPLVTKIHVEVAKLRQRGKEIVLIGHARSAESIGILGQVDGGIHLVETVDDVTRLDPVDGANLGWVTQTTLSVDDTAAIIAALKARFPAITGPKKDDICYATQNRQNAVKFMAPVCDLVIVVGSANSSNTNRLRDVAANAGVESHRIDRVDELRPEWLAGKLRVGITGGASAPEILIREVIARLKEWGSASVREIDGTAETVTFPMPKGIARGKSTLSM
jgi:4-hydroxy-3-methylbut-2-enyl diphosphate reductase